MDVPVWYFGPTVNGVEMSPKLTHPAPLISSDNFMAKWKGTVWVEDDPDPGNTATLFILVDYEVGDQVLVRVDGQDTLPLQESIIEDTTHLLVSVEVSENAAHLLEVWMLETTGPAQIWVYWWDPNRLNQHVFLPVVSRGFATIGQGYPSATPPPSPTPAGGYLPPPTPLPTRPAPSDTIPPVSIVNPLSRYQTTAAFPVTWSGSDSGGAGLASYDVYFRVGQERGGTWTKWQLHTTAVSAVFPWGYDGTTYEFRVRARDRAGNVEAWPYNPDYDTFTTVDLTAPSSQVAPLPPDSPAAFTVAWSGSDATSGVAAYDVQYCRGDCADPPVGWTDWLVHTPDTSALFTAEHGDYAFRCRAYDNAGNVEAWPAASDATTRVDAPLMASISPFQPGRRGSLKRALR